MPMKINEREYRDFSLEAKEGDEKIVKGYASVFNHPYVLYSDDDYEFREQVDPHAFDEADLSDVIFQYNHEGRVFARNSNNTLKVGPDVKGLAIEADLGGTEIGRNLYEEIKGGYTTKMSYGYTVKEDKSERVTVEGREIYTRTVLKVGKVYDVSAVSIPANDATSISVRNLCNGEIEKIKAERLKALELERKRLITKINLCKGE